uniref:Tetratricopeptide repeat-containing serine protease family protein n=1 Tax=Prevotella sp. GTC17253 TaxID=3236793 RepID=A0AB33IWN9_9BACT
MTNIRYHITLFALLLLSMVQGYAQSSNVKNIAKSVFTLTTFNKDGSIHASCKGFFVGNKGEAVSLLTPFKGAASAVVVDGNGNKHPVTGIWGANELYDICKFHAGNISTPAPLAQNPATVGSKTFLVDYSMKSSVTTPLSVTKVEKFNQTFNYYVFDKTIAESATGTPISNANGQIVGIAQLSGDGGTVHATDVRLVNDFKTTGLSLSDPILRTTDIRAMLPADEQQALLMVMMSAQQCDSLTHAQYVDDYIQAFPKSSEGYSTKALLLVEAKKYEQADKLMMQSIANSTKKDEAHSNYAKVILRKEIYHSQDAYPAWNMDKALAEAQEAYKITPAPIYQHQIAQIIYAKGQYEEAYKQFMDLTKTPLRNGELFYEAAQCKQQLKAPQTEIMALLDSAIAACPRPLTSVAAPYILAKAYAYDENKEWRKALANYNQYDTLMLGRVDHFFYYTRYKCELQVRQYQQALTDIARALILNPQEPTYYAEMASLQLRVRRFDDAYETSRRCTMLAPEYADGWLLLGLAQMERNQKEEAKKALEKAKELGDTRADQYLKKL